MPYRIASVEGLMHGLYLLWWVQEKHVPPAAVAAILAAGDLTLLAIELPTGWFADRFGHRTSLVVGSLVQVAGMLWCWLANGVEGLVIASVLVALGDGFRSGASDALLYRTCFALEREASFQPIQARASAIESASLIALVLLGGLIVTHWGFAAGWIAESLLCAAGLVMACVMVEPPPAVRPDEADDAPARWWRPSLRILGVILPAALLGSLASAASFLAQTGEAADAASVTILVAAISGAEAAGSAAAARVRAGGARQQIVLAVCGAVLFAAALVCPIASPLLVPALAFLDGLARPLRAALIQRAARDDTRARMASLASACDMGVSTIVLPVAGAST